MKEHNRNNTQNHDTRYNVVHPQCRGYVHRTVFYSTFYKKTTVLICALSCRSLQVLKAMNIAAGLCTHSCRSPNLFTNSSAHTAAEVVHAHSWDLTFSYKLSLSFASIPFS